MRSQRSALAVRALAGIGAVTADPVGPYPWLWLSSWDTCSFSLEGLLYRQRCCGLYARQARSVRNSNVFWGGPQAVTVGSVEKAPDPHPGGSSELSDLWGQSSPVGGDSIACGIPRLMTDASSSSAAFFSLSHSTAFPTLCLYLCNKYLAFEFLSPGFLLGKSNKNMCATLSSLKEPRAWMIFQPAGPSLAFPGLPRTCRPRAEMHGQRGLLWQEKAAGLK